MNILAPPRATSWRLIAVGVFVLLAASLVVPPTLAGSGSHVGSGKLSVTTAPELPSVITIDGIARNTTAISDLELPEGAVNVSFSPVDGYLAAPDQVVNVTAGQAAEIVGEFVPAGKLKVVTEPAGLNPVVLVNDIERDRGAAELWLQVGTHVVCGSQVTGYETPPCTPVDIQHGSDHALTLRYEDTAAEPAGDDDRVTDGLAAMYTFEEGSGTIVRDVAGVVDGLDLTVSDASAVSWTNAGLRFDTATVAKTSSAPAGLYDRLLDSESFTVEAWVTPANTTQSGPARILTFGRDTSNQNFILGQGDSSGNGDRWEVRMHERSGDWRLISRPGTANTQLAHLVATRDQNGTVTLYLDGQPISELRMAAEMTGWDTSYLLGIGQELSEHRPWLGTYHLLAIYDDALSAAQVANNFQAGPGADITLPDSPGEDAIPEPDNSPDEGPSTPPPPLSGDHGTTSQLSHHGITWTFDGEYEYGQYVNGDYWVVGPVTINDIAPHSRSGGRVMNGSMVNPSRDTTGNRVGYDSAIRDISYTESFNVALDVTPSNPLVVDVHSSLVSTISVPEPNSRPGIDTAVVLTVVDTPPPAASFRPPYSGSDKTARFTTDDLRYDLLPRLAPVEGAPDPQQLAGRFERVWLDHVGGWGGRSAHPRTSMPDYGRDLASRLGEGALTLMLDHSDAEKRDLLVNYVQIGIDLYGVVETGGETNWVPNGGHAQGRKWPILFAGTMLDDPGMANIGQRSEVHFGEDAQTFYVTQQDVDRGTGYTSSHLGLPEWGIRHATDPSRSQPSWDAPYRRCCTANSWSGHVLAARIMDLEDEWNHDPLFDYTDRFIELQEGAGSLQFWQRPFTQRMWETYGRAY